MATALATCELCTRPGGEVIHDEEKFRVVLVDDALYPGTCRVIWNEHSREMTDLPVLDRILFMDAVWQTEAAVREIMQPHKINIASLGNVVPHLHWHVIPRYADDAHFPDPVWTKPHRKLASADRTMRIALLPALRNAIVLNFTGGR